MVVAAVEFPPTSLIHCGVGDLVLDCTAMNCKV
jgi:hypothetical protein